MRDKIRVRVPQTHKKNKSKPEIVKYQQKYSSVSRNQTRPQKHYEYQVYEYWYSRSLDHSFGEKMRTAQALLVHQHARHEETVSK